MTAPKFPNVEVCNHGIIRKCCAACNPDPVTDMKSATPRTDAAYAKERDEHPLNGVGDEWSSRCAGMCEHARQLERENAALLVAVNRAIAARDERAEKP
jgi:hypothetical protein